MYSFSFLAFENICLSAFFIFILSIFVSGGSISSYGTFEFQGLNFDLKNLGVDIRVIRFSVFALFCRYFVQLEFCVVFLFFR